MNGKRAYRIEELERNNSKFLIRIEKIISDLIESDQKENDIIALLKYGFGAYRECLILLCKEKHQMSSEELNNLSRLNPGIEIKDFTSTYDLYKNSEATLEVLEKPVNVKVELVEGIGISLADKYWIDDKLISFKTMAKYEWGKSDKEIAEWLLGQKSLNEKSEPDSPLRRYYFDQIDLSVRLNDPNLIQNKLLKNQSGLNIEQFALVRYYNNQPVTEENKNEEIKSIGLSSGEKLKKRYNYYCSNANRLGLYESKKKNENKIKLFESIVDYVDNDKKTKTLDEIKTLRSRLHLE